MEVLALSAHVLVFLGTLVCGLGASSAPLRAAGDALLGFLQRPLSCAVVPWILYRSPVGSDEKDLQPHVDTGLLSREGEQLHRYLGTRAADRPPICLFGDRDGLDRALYRARPADRDTANLGQHQRAVLQASTVTILVAR
jgi:hypothetical protein